MRRSLAILFWILASSLAAQDRNPIDLNFTETPVSEILVHVRDEYGIFLSFDHRELSTFTKSVKGTYSTTPQALDAILEGIPYRAEQEGDIWIILRIMEEPKEYRLLVSLQDQANGETLPFAHVMVNDNSFISDDLGKFSARSRGENVFKLMVSYVGYYMIDTLLDAGDHILEMRPASVNLNEVVIEGKQVDYYSETGSESGVIHLNQKVAGYLPGNGDNSIFNFLRLQPGIMAAGEQTGDIVIWGSYRGQSKIEYDGYTLFGLNNFTENISTINPFAVKSIQVLKAGYGSEEEGRVGGMIQIQGYEGQKDRPVFKMNVNNQTVNGFVSAPLFGSSAISLSYRETYLGWLAGDNINIEPTKTKGRRPIKVDGAISPDYKYRDLHLKWAGKWGRDRFYLSFFRAFDDFNYQVNDEFGPNRLELNALEKNDQWGGSAFYNKSWQGGGQSKLLLSTSIMNIQRFDSQLVDFKGNGQDNFDVEREEESLIREDKIQLSHAGFWGESNYFKTGGQYVANHLGEQIQIQGQEVSNDDNQLQRIGYFIENEWNKNVWKLRAGSRIDYLPVVEKAYFQPRVSMSWGSSETIRLSASWGRYTQFLHQNSAIDSLGNLRFIWDISDDGVPVAESSHFVTGASGVSAGFSWRANFFNKTTKGLNRYLESGSTRVAYEGNSRGYGIDLYLGKEFKGHRFWTAYTWSNTEEYFGYFDNAEYRRSLQDQRHEIKTALLLDFNPVYFSANYVYGSGLPDPGALENAPALDTRYSRLDVSLRVKISESRPYLESGVNILNVLDEQNIKFNNVIRVPDSETSNISILAESIPFTAMLFAKIIF